MDRQIKCVNKFLFGRIDPSNSIKNEVYFTVLHCAVRKRRCVMFSSLAAIHHVDPPESN